MKDKTSWLLIAAGIWLALTGIVSVLFIGDYMWPQTDRIANNARQEVIEGMVAAECKPVIVRKQDREYKFINISCIQSKAGATNAPRE